MPDNIRAMWSEEELDQALATLHPPSDADDRAFGQARAELLVSAGGSVAVAPAGPRAAGRGRRWGRWAAVFGTAAAVVAGVLVVQTIRSDGTQVDAAASEKLNIAADRINAVDEPLGPGQYRYIATHAWWMTTANTYSYLEENLIETWVPADQKQDWLTRRSTTGERKWLSGNEADAAADGIPLDPPGALGEQQAPCGDWSALDEDRETCAQAGTWQTPTAEFLASLPRDPEELYDRLRADTDGRGKDPSLEMVVYVADLLRTGLAPADLRAALYRVLAKVPGLQITEQVANVDGRKGTAFGVSAAGERHDVIIDPATGQFIGERQITEDGWQGVPPGTVTGYTSVTTAVVSGLGAPPEANVPSPGGSANEPTSTSGSAIEPTATDGSANEPPQTQNQTPPPANSSQTQNPPPVVTTGR